MALSKLSLFLSLIAFALLLSSNQVRCNENEDYVRQGINTYRKNLNLSALSDNEKASCLADEIADALEDKPCTTAAEFSGDKDPTGTVARLVNFKTLLEECDFETNTTFSGVVLPVCVPKLIGELVIGNYTRSRYAKFLNSSKFTGAGFGTEDDWTVIVLTTGKISKKVSVTSSSGVAKGLAGLVLGLVFLSHLLF